MRIINAINVYSVIIASGVRQKAGFIIGVLLPVSLKVKFGQSEKENLTNVNKNAIFIDTMSIKIDITLKG